MSAFATALASRLPGARRSECYRHLTYEEPFPIADRVWDASGYTCARTDASGPPVASGRTTHA
ncbi:hypothetical protein DDJ31_29855 [Streptomyces griseoviridis]|uniref:Uncharacterized protein n=1 Tax=Streptomyces griseoviridis TaxID=45398 RepID=A0ABX5U4V8_STRGD|nr:hypothetical protein DDJ31_29855 [Streptomyces griseoviridis]